MDIDPNFPTSYLFMLENKSVVPRTVFTPVPNCTPFDWPRKYSPRAMLPPRVVPFVSTHIQNGDVSSNYLDDPNVATDVGVSVIPRTASTLPFHHPTPRSVLPNTVLPISNTVSPNISVSIPTSGTSLDVMHTITTAPLDTLPPLSTEVHVPRDIPISAEPAPVHVPRDIPISAEPAPVSSAISNFTPRRSLRIKVATVPGQYGSHLAVTDKSMHPDKLPLAVISGIVANPADWSIVYSKKALARQSALKT